MLLSTKHYYLFKPVINECKFFVLFWNKTTVASLGILSSSEINWILGCYSVHEYIGKID